MKVIDVRGKKCPMPLVETKKALKVTDKNEAIKVILDSENSVKNVTRYLEDNNIHVSKQQSGGTFELLFKRAGSEPVIEEAESYCTSSEQTNDSFIIVFGKDRLGEGSDDLGNMLVGGMLTTLVETERTPDKIIFINSGINLVINDSPVLSLLKKLEDRGCELLSCGTCLDYFDKMENLEVGRVSNMLEILEAMTSYSKVINI
ncbi:MAG: sulfurtransferase-like selenium metabolism protein YedF [Bacteroidetes bacterium]|nr:sulfurtransferase-like selenium metabolism protein YedF [Bacteroidota bacterium]